MESGDSGIDAADAVSCRAAAATPAAIKKQHNHRRATIERIFILTSPLQSWFSKTLLLQLSRLVRSVISPR
jgi:hypothetical protein